VIFDPNWFPRGDHSREEVPTPARLRLTLREVDNATQALNELRQHGGAGWACFTGELAAFPSAAALTDRAEPLLSAEAFHPERGALHIRYLDQRWWLRTTIEHPGGEHEVHRLTRSYLTTIGRSPGQKPHWLGLKDDRPTRALYHLYLRREPDALGGHPDIKPWRPWLSQFAGWTAHEEISR
jgi:hypothetical protein